MAEQTEYVNYNNFPLHIGKMVTLGSLIRAEIASAYTSLGDLNGAGTWKGPQYDKLVTCFNDMIDGFNTILDDIGYKIPNMMNAAGKSWAAVDGGEYHETIIDSVKKLSQVLMSNEAALTWNKAAVDEAKKKIETCLDNAVNHINELYTYYTNMNADWKGDDYSNNSEDIKKYQEDVARKVEELKSDFVKYMNESISAYDNVRSAVSEWK